MILQKKREIDIWQNMLRLCGTRIGGNTQYAFYAGNGIIVRYVAENVSYRGSLSVCISQEKNERIYPIWIRKGSREYVL